MDTWRRYADVMGCRWAPDGQGLSADRLPPDVCWVPAGAPVPAILSVLTTCRVVAGLHGCAVSRPDVVAALRRVELPDRCHRQPADQLPADARLALWLAIADVRDVPILVIADPQGFLRVGETEWVPRLLREAGERHRLVLLLHANADLAEVVGARRVEAAAS